MNRISVAVGCALLSASLAAAQAGQGTKAAPGAKATLKDAKGQTVGEVTFREAQNGVLMSVDLRNVPPGDKAFHIHDVGKCEPPTFQSAGPHFAPMKTQHGLLNPAGPHQGDLPNIHVPQSGSVSVEIFAPGVTLKEGAPTSLFDANGSAVVLHAKPDDYTTDPAGNAGDRVACGEVTR